MDLAGRADETLNGRGELNSDKVIFRIEVVFTRFINYPQHSKLTRSRVTHDPINFQGLKRSRVVVVLNADDILRVGRVLS